MPEHNLVVSIGQALDRGVEYALAGRQLDAIGLFRGVLKHDPDNFEAMLRLGASLFEIKKYHEALYYFWRGRKINRRHPLALTNYGLCISQLGHWEEGFAELNKALYHAKKIGATPQVMALIYNNLGNVLEKLGRYEEALATLDQGLALNPKEQFALYNKGIALLRLNRCQEGIVTLDQALALKPSDNDARYNRSMGRLILGDLPGGLADYEARLANTETEIPYFGLPLEFKWTGQDLTEKILLVHGEQGIGDYIQFFRYLPLIRACGSPQIKLYVHSGLRQLTVGLPNVEIIEPGTIFEANGMGSGGYDYWTALLSLPHCLGLDREEDIPPPWVPTITDEQLPHNGAILNSIALSVSDSRPTVGICWAGNWLHKNDAHRSIPLATFARMFDAPVDFLSVQQMRSGETDEFAGLQQQHANLKAFYLTDWRDTAAVIKSLDLVISADTAVAHLAATLGKPTWILIPKFSTDWRWQLERTDSPWYPAAKLYRQDKIGDWPSVIARIRDDLTSLAAVAQRAA